MGLSEILSARLVTISDDPALVSALLPQANPDSFDDRAKIRVPLTSELVKRLNGKGVNGASLACRSHGGD